MVIVLLQHTRVIRHWRRLRGDGVALSTVPHVSRALGNDVRNVLQNKEIIVLQQVVVAIPRLRSGGMVNGRELVKDSRRGFRSVVEEEQDPQVEDSAMLAGQDNGSLVIRVVGHKVAHRSQDLWRLVGCEDVVAAPHLTHGVRLHRVRGHHAEVVAASLQSSEEIYKGLVSCTESCARSSLPSFLSLFAFTIVPLARTTSKLITLLAAQPYWVLKKLIPPALR